MSAFFYQNEYLMCERVRVFDLAKIYQTPLYIYSQSAIKENYQYFNQAFSHHNHLICYAVKANSNLAVLNTLAKLGAGFNIASLGELMRVLAAGGRADTCVFSGVAKSEFEIKRALLLGILCFNIESEAELERVQMVAKNLTKVAPISVRINPDVDAKTHPYISTGLKNNKFGVSVDKALGLYLKARTLSNVKIYGIDCHIGSQITESSPFLNALTRVLELIGDLEKHDIFLKHINLGGGFGIRYQNEKIFDLNTYARNITGKIGNYKLIIEPGRALVGTAGIFVTQVEFLKKDTHKSFAIIDGAMNDLLRPALYQAYHEVLPVVKHQAGVENIWDIVGPVCETSDFLAKDRMLNLKAGDFLALMSVGAYGFVMSSNYNSRVRAAEVMVCADKHYLVRAREKISNLFAHEYVVK